MDKLLLFFSKLDIEFINDWTKKWITPLNMYFQNQLWEYVYPPTKLSNLGMFLETNDKLTSILSRV